MENYINVIAGRPGAGKTIWACNEAASLASDPNNTVVYIGHMKEFERIVRKAGADKRICSLLGFRMQAKQSAALLTWPIRTVACSMA